MKKQYIFGFLFIIIGMLLLFIPFGIAPICKAAEGAKPMKCFWTGRAVCGIGGLIALLGCIFCFLKNTQKGIAVANILIGIYTIMLFTVLIGSCKSAAMPCNKFTRPAVFLVMGIFIIINVVYLFLNKNVRE